MDSLPFRPAARKADKIFAEQVDLLYRMSRFSYLGTLVSAVVLTFALWSVTSHAALFLWLGGVFAISLARYGLFRRYFYAAPPPEDAPRWAKHFVVGCTATGCAWGVLGSVLYPPGSLVHQFLIIFVIAGMVVTGVAVLAPLKRAFVIFLACATLPLVITEIAQPDPFQLSMGLLCATFAVVVLAAYQVVHRVIVDSLRFKYENTDLVTQLSLAKSESDRASRELLKEIAGHKLTEEALRQSSNRLEALIDASPLAIAVLDSEGVMQRWNRAAEQLFGWSENEVLGRRALYIPDAKQDEATRFRKLILSGNVFANRETVRRHRDGRLIPVSISAAALHDSEGRAIGIVALYMDITAQAESRARIYRLAHYDALTGLPNRELWGDRLNQALVRARRVKSRVAVMFIDIDRFKNINDTLGHSTGDSLLKLLAERMGKCVRQEDTLARQGGDEFVVLLPRIGQDQDAGIVAQKILNVCAEPFAVDGHELHVSVSIGISVFPQDGDDSQALTRNADAAMYRAKDLGRNNYQFYTQDINQLAHERLILESGLRRAIERGEFVLQYQPQMEVKTGRIFGVEALLRWRHPEMGLVPPWRFIPLAEENGLIVPIGQWALQVACADFKRWREAGIMLESVSVNLSTRQLRETGLVGQVWSVLLEAGFPAHCLELEITESSAMEEANIRTLRALKDMGVRIAIDDFGTGYSSLSYLKHFPVDTLKIDQSFVREIASNSADRAIVNAIIALASGLKLTVVAEGVETKAQLDALGEGGCDIVQGYFFARPMPEEDLLPYLKNWGAPP